MDFPLNERLSGANRKGLFSIWLPIGALDGATEVGPSFIKLIN